MLDTGLRPEPEAPPPADQKARRPAAQNLTKLIISQLSTLQACQLAVMEVDNVEAIHKMRVTTRRLQASLDLLQTGPLASEVKRIKKRLRKWRQMLSLVRNYDVFLIMVHKQGFSPRTGRPREQFEHLHEVLHRRRGRRMAEIRKRLARINIEAIVLSLGLPVLLPPQDGLAAKTVEIELDLDHRDEIEDTAEAPALDESAVGARTADRLEQRLAEFQLLVAESHPTNDPQELHQLRIAAKRLRYLFEITTELGYGSATAALTYLRSLQDRIGEWHDLHALEEEIIGIVTTRDFVAENLAESSAMLSAAAQMQKKKERLVSRIFPVTVPKTVALATHRLVRSLRRRKTIPDQLVGGPSKPHNRRQPIPRLPRRKEQ
jgi:CHAD domain-containing protein